MIIQSVPFTNVHIGTHFPINKLMFADKPDIESNLTTTNITKPWIVITGTTGAAAAGNILSWGANSQMSTAAVAAATATIQRSMPLTIIDYPSIVVIQLDFKICTNLVTGDEFQIALNDLYPADSMIKIGAVVAAGFVTLQFQYITKIIGEITFKNNFTTIPKHLAISIAIEKTVLDETINDRIIHVAVNNKLFTFPLQIGIMSSNLEHKNSIIEFSLKTINAAAKTYTYPYLIMYQTF